MVHRQKAYQDGLANPFFLFASIAFYIIVLGNDIKNNFPIPLAQVIYEKGCVGAVPTGLSICVVCSYIANYAFTSNLLSYCVRSIMLLRMISLASGEKSYCSKITFGSLISSFLNSGSLAALRSTSLIISASFCC